jgi:hypothetical protein
MSKAQSKESFSMGVEASALKRFLEIINPVRDEALLVPTEKGLRATARSAGGHNGVSVLLEREACETYNRGIESGVKIDPLMGALSQTDGTVTLSREEGGKLHVRGEGFSFDQATLNGVNGHVEQLTASVPEITFTTSAEQLSKWVKGCDVVTDQITLRTLHEPGELHIIGNGDNNDIEFDIPVFEPEEAETKYGIPLLDEVIGNMTGDVAVGFGDDDPLWVVWEWSHGHVMNAVAPRLGD